MFALILAMAVNDSTIKAQDSIATVQRVSFHREGVLKAPPAVVALTLTRKDEAKPESLTTCYQSQYGSCWSEN